MEDHSGVRDNYSSQTSPNLTAFLSLTPEAGEIISTFAPEAISYAQKVANFMPDWYIAYGEAVLGTEHGLNHPIDSYQLFMAKSWIENELANNLERYIDIPWLYNGDLFYVQKLAEVIKRYRGAIWQNALHLTGVPGDHTIYLSWQMESPIPAGSTWKIEYQGTAGSQSSPISNIPAATHQFTLAGMQNYFLYSVNVILENGGMDILKSNDIQVMPSNLRVMLPNIMK